MKIYRVKKLGCFPNSVQFHATKAEATKDVKRRTQTTCEEYKIDVLEIGSGKAMLRSFCEYLWYDAVMECECSTPVRRPTAERMREES